MKTRLMTPIAFGMAAVCWLGLGLLVILFNPGPAERFLFLCLLCLAASFTSAPLFLAVHRRLSASAADLARRQTAVWREAGLVGILFGLCAWLRFIRVLSWVNALLLVAVLALTEVLLLARE